MVGGTPRPLVVGFRSFTNALGGPRDDVTAGGMFPPGSTMVFITMVTVVKSNIKCIQIEKNPAFILDLKSGYEEN